MPALSKTNQSTQELILYEIVKSLYTSGTIKQDADRSAILEKNTVMGKLQVVSAITPAAGGSNVGDGTCTVASVVGVDGQGRRVIPKPGTWKFILTAALVGKIQDPDGVDVVEAIALNDGSTAIVQYAGIIFTITDGATAFEADDEFSLPVVADGDYTPLDFSSVLGAAYPVGIYTGPDIAAADLVAGDVANSVILENNACVDEELLVFENSLSEDSIVPETGLSIREYLERKSLILRPGEAMKAAQRD